MCNQMWINQTEGFFQNCMVTLTPCMTVIVMATFIPLILLTVLVCVSSMIFYFYSLTDNSCNPGSLSSGVIATVKFWDFLVRKEACKLISTTISNSLNTQGWIWFGYEVDGISNIPEKGPAMIIMYHGPSAVDSLLFHSKFCLLRGSLIHSVVNRDFCKVWGLDTFCRTFHAMPGSQDSCRQVLDDGHILLISPGGGYEAQFGDGNYEILWRNRVGFAKIALRTNCPIIPVFTQNVRETSYAPWILKKIFRSLYAWIHLPFLPMYGFFPVKLRTMVGEAVDPITCSTPEELRDVVKAALRKLIDDNQKRPGSILRGLHQRMTDSVREPCLLKIV